VPLTHRDTAGRVQFITGHSCKEQRYDWQRLADPDQTLVIYMGNRNIKSIASNLLSAKLSPQTPCAVVANATRTNQHQDFCTLADLALGHCAQPVGTPAIYIIGKVLNVLNNGAQGASPLAGTRGRSSLRETLIAAGL
jgi:siroheme synthase